VVDVTSEVWSLAQHQRVARHLGQFNGAFHSGDRLPKTAWLRREPVRLLRSRQRQARDAIERCHSDRPSAPAIAFPLPLAARLLDLWAVLPALEAALSRLPQILAHGDVFRHNLRVPSRPADQTVAVDWEYLGLGALGEDPARLLALDLLFGAAPAADETDLVEAIFDGHWSGLADAGWRGSAGDARLGYAAAAATDAIGIGGMLADYLTDAGVREETGRWLNRSPEDTLDQWRATLTVLLCLADAARRQLTAG
jgi:hypothetical protein